MTQNVTLKKSALIQVVTALNTVSNLLNEGLGAEDKTEKKAKNCKKAGGNKLTTTEVAHTLGTGRNRFLAFLREMGIVDEANTPREEYIEAGLITYDTTKSNGFPSWYTRHALLFSSEAVAQIAAVANEYPEVWEDITEADVPTVRAKRGRPCKKECACD